MTLNPIFGKLFSELISNGYICNEPIFSTVHENDKSLYYRTKRKNVIEFREYSDGSCCVCFYFGVGSSDVNELSLACTPCVATFLKTDDYYLDVTSCKVYVDGVSVWFL